MSAEELKFLTAAQSEVSGCIVTLLTKAILEDKLVRILQKVV